MDSPASTALARVLTVTPAVLRLTCGIACAIVAPAVRTPPVYTPLLIAVVSLLTGWSIFFAARILRHGINPPLIAVELTLTAGTCLLIRWLVAPEVLPGEVSWIAILASTTVIIAQLTLPARRSIPAGLLIVGTYTLGARLAGNNVEAIAHAIALTVQTACGAALAFVGRRSSRLADAAFASYQRTSSAALSARVAREAERQQNRDLHDTVLSTLTVVGLGAVAGQSPMLRERAAADLRTLAALASADAPISTGGRTRPTALDERLAGLLDRMPALRVTTALTPCLVPAAVAAALTDSAAAALSNVVRHAPGATVSVRLARIAGTVVVEVLDDGPGFDPAAVPRHRYGLRESVHGRMATVGGRAEIRSAPGQGTRIRLEWSGVD